MLMFLNVLASDINTVPNYYRQYHPFFSLPFAVTCLPMCLTVIFCYSIWQICNSMINKETNTSG